LFAANDFLDLIKRGEALLEVGQPERAVLVFEEALALAKDMIGNEGAISDGFYYLGNAQREAGQLEQAEQNIEQAMFRYSTLTPHPRGVVDCMNWLGMIYEDREMFNLALRTLDQSQMMAEQIGYYEQIATIELNKRNVNAQVKIRSGMAHAEKQNWQQALSDLRDAVGLNSGVTATRAFLAIVCAQYGESLHLANRVEEAEKLYRESISSGDHLVRYFSDTIPLLPTALSSAYYHIALIEEGRGLPPKKIIKGYEKAIDINPSMTPAYNNLANAILDDDPCRALVLYKKFVQLVDLSDGPFKPQARIARSKIARLEKVCPD
jgi:tetratricopeptide (TPR) repeat protein